MSLLQFFITFRSAVSNYVSCPHVCLCLFPPSVIPSAAHGWTLAGLDSLLSTTVVSDPVMQTTVECLYALYDYNKFYICS